MDLNTILIILGIVALIFLVVHGIWANRRERSQYFQNENTFTQASRIREPQESPRNFDSPSPTVVTAEKIHSEGIEAQKQQDLNFEQNTTISNEPKSFEKEINEIKISLPKSSPKPQVTPIKPISNEVPNLADKSIAELEANADPEEGINSSSPIIREQLSKVACSDFSSEDKIEYPMNSKPKPQYQAQQPLTRETTEIKIEPKVNLSQSQEVEQIDQNLEKNNSTDEKFMMLYIVAPENREFNGANIAQVLDDLGFIYGEKQIYHRHLDLSITSPILFSVANIQQPGTFDPDNMTDFYTIGLAIFMQLPSYGNDLANLRLMIRAARNIAEELGGFVLTDKQVIFTDEAEEAYLNKVA